ncbi:sulfonate ABC transporter ATP-binding protein [Rhizobium rhizosphaerae]|uniref:Sulfonate ABC transporter ATP-binding protein n=1 Tax=Xaviernesmea rhizosphaerae TaxID=1672749 RepID=A0ABX3PA84_9HYPH|nr:ABC transporter ATP-binding protein [Xaviernesmea rhizosphaerae]OQP85350.1 sulfonate ABC transporter ATP-binding protein [Xaviernesmea rhizosphaerae]
MPSPLPYQAPAADARDSIAVKGLAKVYGAGADRVEALGGIDLTIPRGAFVTLFGPSGCGKSTLLRILAGLEEKSAGAVTLFGQTPETAARAKNIAWVPQSSALLPWLTIRDNVLLSRRLNRRADRDPACVSRPEDADQVLRELGLADFAHHRPAALSGGMRQRAAIARGFVQGAPLMLMDEPFSALDELTRDALRLRLLEVWERHRKTVVFVTHSAAEAVLLSDRVVVMTPRPGRIEAVIDIDLPRPRGRDAADSPAFDARVRAVKDTLRRGWEGEE